MIWLWIPLAIPVGLVLLAMLDPDDVNEWVH